VNYVEDRDLWRWQIYKSKEVNAYISTLPRTFKDWDAADEFLEGYLEEAQDKGGVALRVVDRHVENMRKRAGRGFIRGHDVPIINTTFAISEVVGALAEGEPFAAGWFQNQKGEYVYSLRSREDGMDVSEIAEHFGGGGHSRAAGFSRMSPLTLS
jgi:oligoribonuclease NrnB/cAMP/cGMP phosphodiesterase (DHH superfamily)